MSHIDAMRRSGATYRQLLHWTNRGYLHAYNGGGTGFPFEWSDEEIRVAGAMKRMTDAGILPAAAARAARNGGVLAPGVRVLLDELAEVAP